MMEAQAHSSLELRFPTNVSIDYLYIMWRLGQSYDSNGEWDPNYQKSINDNRYRRNKPNVRLLRVMLLRDLNNVKKQRWDNGKYAWVFEDDGQAAIGNTDDVRRDYFEDWRLKIWSKQKTCIKCIDRSIWHGKYREIIDW